MIGKPYSPERKKIIYSSIDEIRRKESKINKINTDKIYTDALTMEIASRKKELFLFLAEDNILLPYQSDTFAHLPLPGDFSSVLSQESSVPEKDSKPLQKSESDLKVFRKEVFKNRNNVILKYNKIREYHKNSLINEIEASLINNYYLEVYYNAYNEYRSLLQEIRTQIIKNNPELDMKIEQCLSSSIFPQ